MSVVYRVDVTVTAPVMDTEVTSRVKDAVLNLFPGAELEERHGEVVGTVHQLERFSELLHEQSILDTARGAFFGNRHEQEILDTARAQFAEGRLDGGFEFALKKQAAFEGVVNFAVGNPGELGDITVRVEVRDPGVEAYVDHVAPPTEDGRPVTDG